MKKILTGLLGIMLVAGLVSGTAYAAFTDTVQVNGISINAGNADLQIFDGANYQDNWNVGLTVNDIYPGYTNNTLFTLKNASLSNIALNITGQLTSATGDWNELKDVVFVEVQDATNAGDTTTAKSLADWNAGAVTFPANPLANGATQEYKLILSVAPGAGDEIAGKALTGITFNLVGTQTP